MFDRPRIGIWVLVLAGWLGTETAVVQAEPFYRDSGADPAIPTPQGTLGYTVGERFTPHFRVLEYLRALAAASDRVTLVPYGETYEGRPLVLLLISDPEHLERIETLQDNYRRLADPRTTDRREAADLAADLPIAVWLSFNIHGEESSPTEAAMALAYRLAADRDPAAADLLRETVVIIDPCLNPDGRDRYVSWVNGVVGSRPDPTPHAREHNQPWPGGRYNHYLFDLNRDWAWLTQQESRDRARAYLAWRPQVHVDFHEMWAEASYFFFPPERPVHPHIPRSTVHWAEVFGRGNAAAFDTRGWRYYSAESFDLYYPGYGDSWPSFHGAVGMTYEQAGHGFAGPTLARDQGDTLTLAIRTEHHYTAALATVRTAAENRVEQLLDYHRFFEPIEGGPQAFVFPPGNDPPRVADLVGLLQAQGAEVHRTVGAARIRGLRSYENRPGPKSIPAGTYVVKLDQPLHRFLRAVLEPETAIPDTFFYDVSAWSLPLAYGIEAYWTESPVGEDLELLSTSLDVHGTVKNADASYAFLIPWDRNGAPRALAWLQEQESTVYATTREITTAGRKFGPGTLVLFQSRNERNLRDLVTRVAKVARVDVYGVDSGLTPTGPDLGSSQVQHLRRPKVAVLADEPASPTSVGACWFLLDRLYDIPHSLLRIEELTREALAEYTTLVFPDDGAGGVRYGSAIDSATVAVIQAWVESGGVFVGLAGGGFYATAGQSGLSTVEQGSLNNGDDDLDDDEVKDQKRRRSLETRQERRDRKRREDLPGAIYRVQVDSLHPLGFGYNGDAHVLKRSDRILDVGPPGTNVAVFPESPRVAGYAMPKLVAEMVNRPFLVAEPRGEGSVVIYSEDPNFRLFWDGLTRLFLNSIFFLGNLD